MAYRGFGLYAFNPGTVSEDMMMNYMWEASGTVQKISYTCIDEYGANTGHANYDVMYAMAKGQTKRHEQRNSEI